VVVDDAGQFPLPFPFLDSYLFDEPRGHLLVSFPEDIGATCAVDSFSMSEEKPNK
jgi:hypothetical protein